MLFALMTTAVLALSGAAITYITAGHRLNELREKNRHALQLAEIASMETVAKTDLERATTDRVRAEAAAKFAESLTAYGRLRGVPDELVVAVAAGTPMSLAEIERITGTRERPS